MSIDNREQQIADRNAKLDAVHERFTTAVAGLVTGTDWRKALEFTARPVDQADRAGRAMSIARTGTRPQIPVVLPVVKVRLDDTGHATVTLDGDPYDVPADLERNGVRRVVQELADRLGPIRVEITEADGERFIDIETPHSGDQPRSAAPEDAEPSTARRRFAPGEDVIVAVAVGHHVCDHKGRVTFQLPPALTHRFGSDVVLVGQASGVVTTLRELESGAER